MLLKFLSHIVSARYFLAILLYLPLAAPAQTNNKYPQNYFRWPLDLEPEIVANMGELRNNHWHMGLDMRTAQKVNQRVYAAADGYISYIGIRPLSYGRFIMITHPNGLTTLYGHLNDFNPELEKYTTDEQYRQQSWAVELRISKNKFPVKKGDFISYSGTTGGSQGPHVHFEIRDTKTDKCLNPLLFGMPLQDDVRPTIVKLAMYDRLISTYTQSPKFISLKNTDSGYITLPSGIIKTGSQKISFAIQAYDRINGSNNQDGIYSAKLFFDEQLQVAFVIDSIDYDETDYINSHIDYKLRANGGIYLQHLSKLPGDAGKIYHTSAGNGEIELTGSDPHIIRIEVADAYGNISVLNFQVQYDEMLSSRSMPPTTQQIFFPGYVNVFEKPGFEVYLPERALYDTVTSFYFKNPTIASNAFSALHQLNDETIPVHDHITVRIKPDKPIPAEWRNKMVIKRTSRSSDAIKAKWQDDWLYADFDAFGSFQAFADTKAPSINELGKADTINLSPASRIVFTPTDDFGVKSFRAELDGEWLRFTNDKGRSWIYIFDERCPYGMHELKVTVEDIVGNKTTKTWWFKKYPYTPPPPKKKPSKKKKSTAKKKTTKKK